MSCTSLAVVPDLAAFDIRRALVAVGTRKRLPVYVERTILDLESVHVNGGRRGFLIRLAPQTFVDVLAATPVSVATGE